jgi:branched-chain amino acid transport system ATP-binding protein
VLEAKDVSVFYGAIRAVSGVDVTVIPGEVTVMLGANGAGKTSTLGAVSGFLNHSGTVTVEGQPVATPAEARRHGVVHVVQGRGLFRALTVEQNLRLGAYGQSRRAARDAIGEAVDHIPEVAQWMGRKVASLSGGQQALVALARLMAGRPRYALLDEPTLSLSPVAVDRLYRELQGLVAHGVGLLLVEQYVPRAMSLADRLVVLERGRTIYSGDPQGAGEAEDLVAAYLGSPATAHLGVQS